jgi:Rps23 Pro-64 3,4-dihydroxylase Tpa1-like proline 4-hydroxylase
MGVKHTKKTLSTNKEIHIFDNVFSSSERSHHIQAAQQADYALGGNSNTIFRNQKDTFFLCMLYDYEEVSDTFNFFGFMQSKNINPVMEVLSDYQLTRSWITVSSPLTKYYWHVDISNRNLNAKTLLYHVNDKWDNEWGGETLFANDDGDCEYCVEYKPGRIVIFDGTIAHKPAVISPQSEEFRFMYVMQYSDEIVNEKNNFSNLKHTY